MSQIQHKDLIFPHDGSPFFENPCVNFDPTTQQITIGPMYNGTPDDQTVYVLLWYGAPCTWLSCSAAMPLVLETGPGGEDAAGPGLGNPYGNMLVSQFIPSGCTATWQAYPAEPMVGSGVILAQGFPTGSWNVVDTNALNSVHVLGGSSASLTESTARMASITRPPDLETYFAFAVAANSTDNLEKKARVVVDTSSKDLETLQAMPSVQRVLHFGPFVEPEEVKLVLGRERLIGPGPNLPARPLQLSYTGEIRREVAKALAVGDPVGQLPVDLRRDEVRQGILSVKRRTPKDVCAVRVHLENTVDGSFLGGLTVVVAP
jgi:hypothetical protein